MKVICSSCHSEKEESDFYKNSKKLNGLESQCKACILLRKSKKYSKEKAKKILKSSAQVNRKSKVLEIEDCTFEIKHLNKSNPEREKLLNKVLTEELLCHLKK